METERGAADRRLAVSAAVRRFPRFELTIYRLMDRDETFREICEELAEAELALSRADKIAPAMREAWSAEWQGLVERLVGEVGAALTDPSARSNVNPGPSE